MFWRKHQTLPISDYMVFFFQKRIDPFNDTPFDDKQWHQTLIISLFKKISVSIESSKKNLTRKILSAKITIEHV